MLEEKGGPRSSLKNDNREEALSAMSNLSQAISPHFTEEQSGELENWLSRATSHADDFRQALLEPKEKGMATVFRLMMVANNLYGTREEMWAPGTPLPPKKQKLQVYELLKQILFPIMDKFDTEIDPEGTYKWETIFSILRFAEGENIDDDFISKLKETIEKNVERLVAEFEESDPVDIMSASNKLHFVRSFCSPRKKELILSAIEEKINAQPIAACHYVASKNERLASAAIKKIEKELIALGLDAEKIISDWRSSYQESQGNAIEQNFRAILKLEEEMPGVCGKLYRFFNISNFGRYPQELLIRQVKMLKKAGPFGIAFYAKDDHNGVFYRAGQRVSSLSESLQEKQELRIFEFGSQLEAVRCLNRIRKTWPGNKISFAIIGAHGGEREITFGKSWIRGRLRTFDLEHPILKRLAELFEKGATIVLDSCSTGGVPVINKGFAISLSSFGFNVIAAKGLFHGIKSFQIIFDNSDKITDILVTPNVKEETMVRFKNDKKITP